MHKIGGQEKKSQKVVERRAKVSLNQDTILQDNFNRQTI